MVAYIASRSPLPLIPWHQDAPAFNVTDLTEHEQPILRHLALPHVRQAGSHTGCGCGFNEGREYLEAYDDAAAERADALESSSRLSRCRLDPTPMPVVAIIVYNAIFVLFFYAFHWVCRHVIREEVGPWMADYAPLCIGTVTCTLFTVVTYAAWGRARCLGPWLVYDKSTGRLTLPREQVTFERSEVVHLQYITTKRLSRGSVGNNDRLSELNLITYKDGERKRWPLLRSNANVRAFDWLLKAVVAKTDLPVVRVTDERLGWNVTERTFGGSAGE